MFLFGFESGFVRDPVPWSLEGFKQVDISETQRPNPQAWLQAQRAGLWSPGGWGKKKNWNRSPSPRPGSFGFGTWAFSFSLYMHCARVIFPAEAFSSVCILCIIGSILYTAWIFVGLTKISFIYIRYIRFLWNLCSQCETESRKTRACSVLFSVYIYIHIRTQIQF